MGDKVLVVGSAVVDLSFSAPRIPAVGETVRGRFAQGLGGKGFNQAVASALAGARTAFLGALGEDAFASPFQARLRELGIEHALEVVPESATGAAAICVDGGGRNSIIVALGANERLSRRFLDQNARMFEGAAVLLLQFETNLEVIDHALRLAREKSPRCIAILNPAPALPEIPASILRNVDYLTPNETELETLSGRRLADEADLPAACAAIPTPGAILATLGERGNFYFRRTASGAESERTPAFPVNAVDTTGAGDAFNGAFAAGLLRYGGDRRKAVAFASAAAAISVTRPGTSSSLARRDEIDAFIKEGVPA